MNFFNSFVLSFLLISSAAQGQTPALSYQSQKAVKSAIITGGLTGAALAGIAMALDGFISPTPMGDRLKMWGFCAAVSSIACATVGGIWSYENTPEKYFGTAQEKIEQIGRNPFINRLYHASPKAWITLVKEKFFRARYPLLKAFNKLNVHYDELVRAQKLLEHLLESSDETLHQQAQELSEYAHAMITLLKNVIMAISSEPNFSAECAAKAEEDAARAQEAAALAQQLHYLNCTTRPQVIYTYSPVYCAR